MTMDIIAVCGIIIAIVAWALLQRKIMRVQYRLLREHSQMAQQLMILQTEFQTNKENSKLILSLLNDLGKAAKTAHKADVDAVAGEVKLLQNIVGQLAKARAIGSGMMTNIGASGKPRDIPADRAPVVRTDYTADKILEVVQAGLRSDRVDLYIQPIVSLPQRKIRHFECLSRIRDDDDAIILPEQYVQVAEQAGLMAAIDNLLLFRCVQLVRRANINNFHGSFFCNLSKHTLHDSIFFEDFLQFLSENKELATRMVFEISQADFDERDGNRARLLLLLANAGCRLALSHVSHMNLDIETLERSQFKFIKVDANILLQSLRSDPPLDLMMLRRTLGSYHIDLIIERIESEQVLLDLLDYNIDFGQGYLFGEPKLSRNLQ